MKILVTGGFGFIGRNLAKKLASSGYIVTIIDNSFRWKREMVADDPNITIVDGDIGNEEVVNAQVKKADVVFHLAAVSQVIASINNPNLCHKYNVQGTETVVKACAVYKKKIIFSSSREVYGSTKYLPVKVDHALLPENPYAFSKVAGEKIIKKFSKDSNLKYIIFRISNVIGEDDKDRVIPIFIRKALYDLDIEIYGKDKMLDFIYIEDVVDALIRSLLLDENVILNLGLGHAVSLAYAARLIIKDLKSKSKIIYKNNRSGEIRKYYPDISLTKEKLNWKPQISFDTAISYILTKIKKYQ